MWPELRLNIVDSLIMVPERERDRFHCSIVLSCLNLQNTHCTLFSIGFGLHLLHIGWEGFSFCY